MHHLLFTNKLMSLDISEPLDTHNLSNHTIWIYHIVLIWKFSFLNLTWYIKRFLSRWALWFFNTQHHIILHLIICLKRSCRLGLNVLFPDHIWYITSVGNKLNVNISIILFKCKRRWNFKDDTYVANLCCCWTIS